MKITYKKEFKQIKELKEVKTGQVFAFKNKVYMKLGAYTDLNYNAIRLTDGLFENLHQYCEVEILNCEIVIHK